MKKIEVGEEDLRLHHVIERRAGGLEGLFQILQDVGCLQLDIRAVERKTVFLARLRRNAGLEVAGELAGGEDEVADHERLIIVGERARNARFHDCDRHVFPLSCARPSL